MVCHKMVEYNMVWYRMVYISIVECSMFLGRTKVDWCSYKYVNGQVFIYTFISTYADDMCVSLYMFFAYIYIYTHGALGLLQAFVWSIFALHSDWHHEARGK